MQAYFFSTQNMTVGYDGIPLIKDIDIELKKGEILTLIGPNGAGKSTILKSIIGQLSLLAGTVLVEDARLDGISEKERAKKVSVVLTQRIHPEMMTCMEVVEMGRYPYTGKLGILSEEDKKIVWETMELVHITDLADKEFLTLSDGQRQRVMLAKAIAQEPEILVLDEPTSFLDIRYKLEFLSILQEMTKHKNLTVIMSLHELDMAERISDKILCVKGAYIEKFGTPDTIFVSGYIRKLYGITMGTFDECSGNLELPEVTGKPEVFVIAGNGSGTPLFRSLQRKGVTFAAGILWENDRDTACAEALAVKVIKESAFCRIKPEKVEMAKREIDRCKTVICTLSDFGEWNMENEELMLYAKQRGKLRCQK
ncbi:MAG: ABC transporter ATP-binding protein [Lachnospiraceae bacterium]|nr:ABC transporter ATP-binding protein [Lachnospiraceae bacterium]